MLRNFKKYLITIFFVFSIFSSNVFGLNNITIQEENYDNIISVLDKNEIEFVKKIGEGTEKIVFECAYKNKEMACLYFKPDNGAKDRFLLELDLLRKFNHPNIIKYLKRLCYNKTNQFFIFTELAQGSLQTLLDTYYKELSIKHKLQISLGAISAINYLHQNGIIHQDIKPGNFLYSYNKTLDFISTWLTDFTTIRKEGLSESFKGTTLYAPSENILIKSVDENIKQYIYEVTKNADIHAFGITLYKIFYGKDFIHQMMKENLEEIKKMTIYKNDIKKREPFIQLLANGIRPKLDDSVVEYPIINEIIERCWAKEPEDRPTSKEILRELKNLYIKITNIEECGVFNWDI